MSAVPLEAPRRLLSIEVDGREVRVPEGSTILDACRAEGVDTPTMCFADNLTPVNACRVCMVEVEGSRVLVPSCSRPVEDGMKVRTDTERVRHSRKLVMEFLESSVDTTLASADWHRWSGEYGADRRASASRWRRWTRGSGTSVGPGTTATPIPPRPRPWRSR